MEPISCQSDVLPNQQQQCSTLNGHESTYGNECFMLHNNKYYTSNAEGFHIGVTTAQHENTSERESERTGTSSCMANGGLGPSSGYYEKVHGSDVEKHFIMTSDPMDEQLSFHSGLLNHVFPQLSKCENQELFQKPTKFGLEKLLCFSECVPPQTAGLVCDSNHNSDTKNLVAKIVSTKKTFNFVDVVKSLPAVTTPKCVLTALEDLEHSGLIRRIPPAESLTWMKTGYNGVDIELSAVDSFNQELLASNTSKWTDLQPDETDGEMSNCKNKSRSLPSMAKQYSLSGFSKRPHRKCSVTFLNGRHTEILSMRPRFSINGHGFDYNSNFEPVVPPAETFQELSSYLELTPLQKSIIDVMRQNNRPLTTLEIAKAIGLTTKRDVNSALYTMERAGMIQRVKYQPPVWSLKSRKDPGVIGGERSLKEPSRRKSMNESILSERNRSRSDVDRQADLKPRSRSLNSESDSGAIKSCGLCRISFTTKQQSEEHFQSTKHQNKIAKVTSEPYLKFCEYCKVHLNSKSQANEHFTSGRHEQTVAKSQKAPLRQHPPLQVPPAGFNPQINTETVPFGYQIELYYKTMTNDSAVCFVPTGTGKTLVAALVVAHLLLLNPSRQIIFLVDRVLLVIQQSEYLKNELKNLQVPVYAKDEWQNTTKPSVNGRQAINHGMSMRPVRIGAICGEMRKLEQGIPIFNHDILVVTADCYRNHINNGTLRFEDSALIVLDESHHCNKDHPYNVIVRDYYLIEGTQVPQRPKILGLTASPAGEPSLERTLKKMQRLLANLGGASLLTVTENIPELTEKTSQTEMVCYSAEYTTVEENLLGMCMEYATKCFNLAARLSDFKEYKDVFQPSAGGILSKDDIYPILGVIDNLLTSPKPESANSSISLMHFGTICDCICTLQECGEKVAFDRMVELLQGSCPHGFDWAENQGLPCERIRTYLQQRCIEGSSARHYFSNMASGVAELLGLLLKLEWGENEDRQRSLALVLVKRRCTAVCLAEYLNSCPELRRKLIRTTYIVGHGNGGTDRGMTVAQQIDTLKQIRQGAYQVVVATSVAEEGLDLPACDLVVQMDPPNSVTALVQIRGRARQRKAQFAAICRDKDQARKIKDLLSREENMRQAAEIINGQKLSGIY